MTIILDLTPEEEARLQASAARAGLEAPDYLRSLIPPDDAEYGEWTEQDLADLTRASFERLDAELGPEEGYDA